MKHCQLFSFLPVQRKPMPNIFLMIFLEKNDLFNNFPDLEDPGGQPRAGSGTARSGKLGG